MSIRGPVPGGAWRSRARLVPSHGVVRLIFAAAFLRSVGIGLTGVLLGVYLAQLGFPAAGIGEAVTAGLAGGVCGQAAATLGGDRFGRRRTLVALALLGAAGGLGLALTSTFTPIVALAFLGMVNGMGRDRGAAFALEQAILPGTVPDEERTWAPARYNLVLDAGHAIGSLGGAVPVYLQHALAIGSPGACRLTFVGYGAMGLASALLYLRLPASIELESALRPPTWRTVGLTPRSRTVVAGLSALLGLDALGGGLLSGALLAYWFFRRYGLAADSLAVLFFASRVLNAISHPGAAWLARRVGLLNTMVWTHLPSSIVLLAVPLAPSPAWAVALFLVREALVEMDVPTRQSYVAAVVRPEERAVASGMTNLSRNLAWAVGPVLAGSAMQHVLLASPLLLGGGIKIVYDLVLYGAFRRIRPPEEEHRDAGSNEAALMRRGARSDC